MSHHRKAFIATVGKGDLGDIRSALCQSISDANPDYLLLFATRETEQNARDIISKLTRDDQNSHIHILTEPKEDVERLFKEMKDVVLQKLRMKDIKKQDVTNDFTTGTKAMSAALVLTSVNLNLGRLKYIAVLRDEQGKVRPGQERFYTFEPVGLVASHKLDWAVVLFRQYRFDSVKELLNEIPEGYLNEAENCLRTSLLYLAEAYTYWDLFDHIKFRSAYEKAEFSKNPELSHFRVSDKTLSYVQQLGENLKRGKLLDLTVIDLINNARRRIEEGKYDDATARLYRATEMLAQWYLMEKFGIDTGNVDLNLIPEKDRMWLKSCATGENGKIQIGLYKAYQLLKERGAEPGKDFFKNEALRGKLSKRNCSILAHGTKPMSHTDALELLQLVEEFSRKAIQSYEDKSNCLRFPWQRSELS